MADLKLTSTSHPCVIIAGDPDNRRFIAVRTDDKDKLTFTNNISAARRFGSIRTAKSFIQTASKVNALINPRIHNITMTLELDPSL